MVRISHHDPHHHSIIIIIILSLTDQCSIFRQEQTHIHTCEFEGIPPLHLNSHLSKYTMIQNMSVMIRYMSIYFIFQNFSVYDNPEITGFQDMSDQWEDHKKMRYNH